MDKFNLFRMLCSIVHNLYFIIYQFYKCGMKWYSVPRPPRYQFYFVILTPKNMLEVNLLPRPTRDLLLTQQHTPNSTIAATYAPAAV